MDGRRFDNYAKRISRREMHRGALAVLVAAGVVYLRGQNATARLTSEGVGSRNVGKACKRSSQCCSGICTAGANYCAEGETATCNDIPICFCFETTGGAPFCGIGDETNTVCAACRVDTDCDAVTGPGSACILATQKPFCACETEGFSTACTATCVV